MSDKGSISYDVRFQFTIEHGKRALTFNKPSFATFKMSQSGAKIIKCKEESSNVMFPLPATFSTKNTLHLAQKSISQMR